MITPPSTIIPDILAEPAEAGCAPGNETLGYFAGEISRLGNAIVPQVAAEILRAMMAVDCMSNV